MIPLEWHEERPRREWSRLTADWLTDPAALADLETAARWISDWIRTHRGRIELDA